MLVAAVGVYWIQVCRMFEVALGREARGWQEKWGRSVGEAVGILLYFLMAISLIITLP